MTRSSEQETIDLIQPGDGTYLLGLAVAFVGGPAAAVMMMDYAMEVGRELEAPFVTLLMFYTATICTGLIMGANLCQRGRRKKNRWLRKRREKSNGQ